MARVFSSHESGKPDHGLQPVMPLRFRLSELGPGNRRGGDHMRLAALGGKPRKAPQVAFDRRSPLLDHLATLTRNTITVGGHQIEKITTPTPAQRQAFTLLGATIPITLE